MQQAKIWASQYHTDRVWLISIETAGITFESGDWRKHPPVWDKTHPVQCTENDWRYGKRQVNLGIIESYLAKYGVLSLNNENEQVKKVTKCINNSKALGLTLFAFYVVSFGYLPFFGCLFLRLVGSLLSHCNRRLKSRGSWSFYCYYVFLFLCHFIVNVFFCLFVVVFFLIRGMFEMNCLFLSGDFKFQVSPKVLISCPRSTPRG